MSAEPGHKSAYSPDLRWRVVWQCIAMELSFRKIALSLNISCSTAQTTFKLFEQTGEVSSRGQPSRKETRCLSDADEIYCGPGPGKPQYVFTGTLLENTPCNQ